MNHAETISSPASEYTGSQYPEILDNVASNEVQFDLTVQLKESLNWPSLKISEYDLEMKSGKYTGSFMNLNVGMKTQGNLKTD